MLDFFSDNNINKILIITSFLAFLLSGYTMFTLLKTQRKIRRDELNSQLEEIRYRLEKQLYQVNDKLLANEERWKDVNHLIISSQNINNPLYNSPEINANTFLKKAGVNLNEMRIEKNRIFYLTPFHNDKMETYKTIKNVCSNMNLYLSRGDEKYLEQKNIFSNILESIVTSRLIIANIDGRNPNVFYELGIAHALDKPTIIISNDLNNIPFDLQSQYIILYSSLDELKEKIEKALIDIIINRA